MLNRLPGDAGDWIRDAPGTYTWLLVLLGTSLYVRRLPADRAAQVLAGCSTNLTRLRRAPLSVLLASAFLMAGSSWFFYLAVYTIFHAPTEHWLGTGRWLAVVASAHVGATLLSQGWVARCIRTGKLPASQRDVPDYGVSYGVAGAAGVLTYHIPLPWWPLYLGAVAGWYLYGLVKARDFTALGHVCALAIGFSYFWITP